MRVEVYWNLHRNLYSVRALEGPHKGKVIGHAHKVLLNDARFVVQAAGRAKVLREKKKNVHAFVRGELHAAVWDHEAVSLFINWTTGDGEYARFARHNGVRVSYNPYKAAHFFEVDTGNAVHTSTMVLMSQQMGKAALLAFDPFQMTPEQSRRATY